MKIKILVLALVFLFLLSCENSPEDPFSPEPSTPLPLPSYIQFEFEVTMSITLADETPFLNENDYCTFYQMIADKYGFPPLSISYRKPSASNTRIMKISRIETFQREDTNVDCRLFTTGSSVEEEWLKNAQFIFELKLVPINVIVDGIKNAGGFIFEPSEQQVTLTGWMIDKTGWDNHQFIYFTIIRE